ncbi:unnamed protein product, partial [Penicillium viridicatum]
ISLLASGEPTPITAVQIMQQLEDIARWSLAHHSFDPIRPGAQNRIPFIKGLRFGEVVTPPTQIGDDAFQMDFDDRDRQRASNVEQTPNPETNYSDTCPTSNKAAAPEPAAFQATAGESSEEPNQSLNQTARQKSPQGSLPTLAVRQHRRRNQYT